jgi:HK97 family phage major capsid protein
LRTIQADLQEGFGEPEIKAETLRHVVCAGNDLIQGASFNIERWVLQKVSQGFCNTINNATMVGDGMASLSWHS